MKTDKSTNRVIIQMPAALGSLPATVSARDGLCYRSGGSHATIKREKAASVATKSTVLLTQKKRLFTDLSTRI
jgi:hypothetical protein